MMTQEADAEERAWATRVARAFLASREPATPTADDEPRTRGVLVVAVVPLPMRAQGHEGHEEDGDG